MPVYLHSANLIINKKAIAERYKGGIEQFRKDFAGENQYFTEDVELFSLARMNPDEFDEVKLVDGGLHYDRKKNTSNDYVIISRYGGCLWQVDWLRDNKVFAYHIDCSPEYREKVYEISSKTVDELQHIVNAGGNPFETIR